MPKRLDLEVQDKIVAMFKAGNNVSEISEQIGYSWGAVDRVCVEHGLKETVKRGKSERICPKCKAKDHNAKARFCWKCGEDIRSESVILQEKCRNFCLTLFRFCPKRSLTKQAM